MAETTSRRTTVSKWVYRVCLSLMILGTVRASQLMWDQIPLLARDAEGPVLWIAQFTVMGTPMTLALCCLVMLLRSGAVIWLLGMEFFFTAVPILLGAWGSSEHLMIAAALLAIILAVGSALLTYLVKKQELRAP